MNELIKVEINENQEPIINGRELHEFLGVKERYNDWFSRMVEYGFVENIDFESFTQISVKPQGGRPSTDHALKLDMAKELAMLQRNDQGKKARQYFIQIEKDWNSPEKVMARALILANKQIDTLKIENAEMKPKVIFTDAVTSSKTSILVGDMAKILNQNGINIGAHRFFEWLRKNGYLISRKGTDYNRPTQKAMDLEILEIKETPVVHSDHTTINITPKVTGKGQVYFVNKFLGQA